MKLNVRNGRRQIALVPGGSAPDTPPHQRDSATAWYVVCVSAITSSLFSGSARARIGDSIANGDAAQAPVRSSAQVLVILAR